jgi:hypothetical protein
VRAFDRVEEARRTFRDLPAVHVGTLLPDGSPHVVPLWFVWLEDAVFVTCRRRSRVAENVARDARVVLQFDRGRAWTELAGVLVHGRGEALLPEEPGARRPMSAWFEKYRGLVAGEEFAAYTEEVARPVLIRVRPDRLTGWMHRRDRT